MNDLKCEIKNLNIIFATAVAVLLLLVDVAVWSAVGSPILILRFISAYVKVVPLWLFGLLDFLSFALLGFALGSILGTTCCVYEVFKYRGAFFFVIGLTLAFVHHITFFSAGMFLVSLLVVIVQCFFLTLSVVNFYKVSVISTVILIVGSVWWLYLLIINLFSFFMM